MSVAGEAHFAALQLACVALAAYTVSVHGFWRVDTLVMFLLVGVNSGYCGIVVAHELIHRREKHMQWLGRVLMGVPGPVTSAPSEVGNTPESGMAPQLISFPRIRWAAPSCVCAASIESSSETAMRCPRPVFWRCRMASRMPCTRCIPAE